MADGGRKAGSGGASHTAPLPQHICDTCGRHFAAALYLRQHREESGHTQQPNVMEEVAAHSHLEAGEAASSAASSAANQPWDTKFLSLLGQARVVNYMPRDPVQDVKEHTAKLVQELHRKVAERVAARTGVAPAETFEMVKDIFSIAEDFCKRDSEIERLRKSSAYVKPKPRYLGTHKETGEEFCAYDNPLDTAVEAMLKTQPHTWADLKAFAKRFTTHHAKSEAYDDQATISDTWDGIEFGRFMERVKLLEGEVPLIFLFYYDGLEVVNGLGQARTTWELACFYWALLPLNQQYRMDRKHLRLATVCLKRAVTEVGMDVVINGLSTQGTAPTNTSWGAWMKELGPGLRLDTPEGTRTARGGTALISADTPAAAELHGTKKSVGPSTKCICRNCHACQVNGAHRQACSFLYELPGWKRTCAGRSTVFRLRSVGDVKAYLGVLGDVKAGRKSYNDLEAWLQDMGVNTFLGSLWRLPYYSLITGCPMDIMHIVFEGVGRQLLGALAYVMARDWGLNLSTLVAKMGEYAKTNGLSRNHFPYVNSTRVHHLLEGQDGGLPSSSCSFPGTAMQVAHLLIHLPSMWSASVPEAKRKDPVWQTALCMCKITRILWQKVFTHDDLVKLDKTIWLHDTLMLGIPKLQHLWKPKNHYLCHIPLEILHWGPPRNYWCEDFEHENQLTKNGVTHSNYANVLQSAAEHKALSVANAYECSLSCLK